MSEQNVTSTPAGYDHPPTSIRRARALVGTSVDRSTLVWCLMAVLLCSTTLLAQWSPIYIHQGLSAGDRLGESVSAAGDIDGDLIPDFIVGSPLASVTGLHAGHVDVLSGATGGLIYSIDGPSAYSGLGYSVAEAGDVDGDGRDDFLVGAPSYFTGGGAGLGFPGKAVCISGMNGSIIHAFIGNHNADDFGHVVATAGDVDADGVPDILIGAPRDNTGAVSAGRAVVYSGATGAVLHDIYGQSTSECFGWAVAGPGDLDADGHADFFISAPKGIGSPGTVRQYSGATGMLVTQRFGTSAGAQFGTSMCVIGDIDNDGIQEVAVGSSLADTGPLGVNQDAGQVLVLGLSTSFRIDGLQMNEHLGSAVAGIGDINNDLVPDLLIGASGANNFGAVRIYSGSNGAVLETIPGDQLNAEFGATVDLVGDLDFDGKLEFIVGTPGFDNLLGADAGRARVFTIQSLLIGGGQANSADARLEVDSFPTATTAGPFLSPIIRGLPFSIDLSGAPLAVFELYGSYTLNPGGWTFPGFGSLDIGTGPGFGDVFPLFSSINPYFPFYSLDQLGEAHLTQFVHPSIVSGFSLNIQALIQRPQPWSTDPTTGITVWGALSAAHVLQVQ